MDDIEARLRVRLQRLAAAVPVRASQEVVVERVRPSAALVRPPSATLLVAVVLVAVVAVGVGLASRLAAPATSGGPSAVIPASPPIGSTSPVPSPSNAGASLVVSTTVEEPCPPTEGGRLPLRSRPEGPGREAVGVGPARRRVGGTAISVGIRDVHPAARGPIRERHRRQWDPGPGWDERRVRHLVRGDPDHDFGAGHRNIHAWPVHRGRRR